MLIRNIDLHAVVENCTISDLSFGIDIAGSSNMTIEDNTLNMASSGYGLYMDGSNNDTLFNNTINNLNYGFYPLEFQQQHPIQ